jgi:drug/metabolite transporter (DMT)-like permease
MAKADIAAFLALGAALFIAVGDVLHQRSAHDVTDEPVGHLELFTRLLRDGQWWLGSLMAAVVFALQAAALGLGSVLLVQALLVSALLFALPLSARLAHRTVTRREWLWAMVLASSVALIVTVGNPQAGQSRASLETWIAVVAVMGPALVLCVLGARVWSGSVSAVLLALMSGTMWGVFSVLTKSVADRLDDGSGRCCALPSCTRGGWSRSRARRGSSRRFAPGR